MTVHTSTRMSTHISMHITHMSMHMSIYRCMPSSINMPRYTCVCAYQSITFVDDKVHVLCEAQCIGALRRLPPTTPSLPDSCTHSTRKHAHTRHTCTRHASTHARIRTQLCTHTCARTNTHVHARTRAHAHARTHARTHAHAQARPDGRARTDGQTDGRTDARNFGGWGPLAATRAALPPAPRSFCSRSVPTPPYLHAPHQTRTESTSGQDLVQI